jgi:hypothetical protein
MLNDCISILSHASPQCKRPQAAQTNEHPALGFALLAQMPASFGVNSETSRPHWRNRPLSHFADRRPQRIQLAQKFAETLELAKHSLGRGKSPMVFGDPSALPDLVRRASSPLPAARRPGKGARLGRCREPTSGTSALRRAVAEGHGRMVAPPSNGNVGAERVKRSEKSPIWRDASLRTRPTSWRSAIRCPPRSRSERPASRETGRRFRSTH